MSPIVSGSCGVVVGTVGDANQAVVCDGWRPVGTNVAWLEVGTTKAVELFLAVPGRLGIEMQP
jgi:hypothetical protein